MLNENKYVSSSLELHLFFARIMKEHAIFLEAGFTPKNANYTKDADRFKLKFENILENAVEVSDGIIGHEVLSSGEIITDFTLNTEIKTQHLTTISINKNITIAESKLSSGHRNIPHNLVNYISRLNKNTIELLADFINFKKSILRNVLNCNIYTANYPLLIEHIIREAKLYHNHLIDIEKGHDIFDKDLRSTELFWDQIMMEHALFIRGLLDPTENKLIKASDNFADDYEDLLKTTRNATDLTINSITNETLRKTIKFKEFKQTGTKGISECKIRSIIVPLLADHVLREANHFIRLLKH